MYGNSNAHQFLGNRSLKISRVLSKYLAELPQYYGDMFYIK